MKSYRVYHVGKGGRLHLGEAFSAPDDHAAVETARGLYIDGQAAELWEGGRLVGQFSSLGEFSAGPAA